MRKDNEIPQSTPGVECPEDLFKVDGQHIFDLGEWIESKAEKVGKFLDEAASKEEYILRLEAIKKELDARAEQLGVEYDTEAMSPLLEKLLLREKFPKEE